MINGLSLFSGIGGIDVALSEYVRPVAYCEIEPYCQSVLLSRMQEGNLPKAPIWDDVTTLRDALFDSGAIYQEIDIIYGGFPCQDISIAGAGKGLEGERSGLFFEIVRLAKEIRPQFLFLENVPAITSRGGLRVVKEIASLGYDCRWCVISAASVGALHRRERWFLLANSKHNGTLTSKRRESVRECIAQGKNSHEQKESIRSIERASSIPSDVADTDSKRLQDERSEQQTTGFTRGCFKSRKKNDSNTNSKPSTQTDSSAMSINQSGKTRRDYSAKYWPFKSRADWQEAVSTICRVDDGVPNRVDRLKSLGNAVVPIQVKEAFELLMGLNGNDLEK